MATKDIIMKAIEQGGGKPLIVGGFVRDTVSCRATGCGT